MTKCIVLGAKEESKERERIIFKHFLDSGFEVIGHHLLPEEYEYIELICLNYCDNYDLMFAYDEPDNRGNGALYIGHWNDGVV